MKIGVLGTGIVGHVIAGRLVELGHEVMMGARSADNEKATAWAGKTGKAASNGTFADAAAFADKMIFNCTKGEFTLEVLKQAGAANLGSKVLVDISNPLDFSKGMPPTLSICNDNSLGEEVQKAFPSVKVVKSMNTMNCEIMLNPRKISGSHNVFVSGNDNSAKEEVKKVLTSAGWPETAILDLGDITTARGTEQLLPIWIRLWGALGSADFNFHIQR